MNHFKFNKHGVCTNPEVIEVYRDKSGWDRASVELAQDDKGKWHWGESHHCHNGGGGSPCHNDREGWPTRQEALISALDDLKADTDRHIKKKDKEGDANRKFRKAIEQYKGSLFQTTLF